jgi:hypothetical protein
MSLFTRTIAVLLLAGLVAVPVPGLAQDAAPAPAAPAQAPEPDTDLDLKLSEPDFTLLALPTNLRLPRFKSAFRVTHRFARPLGQGDFGSLLEDFFGLDTGAQIGLEYRFGIARGLQGGIYRTSDRTIEFFSQYSLIQQKNAPISLSVMATIDGTNNFRDSYTPALGAIVSRELGTYGALYVEPMWVNNSNPLPSEVADSNDTFMIGLGARIRIRPTVYLVGEFAPRVSGYDPGVNHGSFGLEKRAGGHVFQVNFSNGFGTTMGQVARGGTGGEDWYLGFNISRKFY